MSDLLFRQVNTCTHSKNDLSCNLFAFCLTPCGVLNLHVKIERTFRTVVLTTVRVGAGKTFLDFVVASTEVSLPSAAIPTILTHI